jgi:hypothetical protein
MLDDQPEGEHGPQRRAGRSEPVGIVDTRRAHGEEERVGVRVSPEPLPRVDLDRAVPLTRQEEVAAAVTAAADGQPFPVAEDGVPRRERCQVARSPRAGVGGALRIPNRRDPRAGGCGGSTPPERDLPWEANT